jgi:hypothetical protein
MTRPQLTRSQLLTQPTARFDLDVFEDYVAAAMTCFDQLAKIDTIS